MFIPFCLLKISIRNPKKKQNYYGNLRWGTIGEGFSVFAKKNNNANLEWGLLELLIIELMGLKTNKDFL
jgi:hypothetical protein